MHMLCIESGPDFGIIQLFMSRLRPALLRATGHKVGIPADGILNVWGYPMFRQTHLNPLVPSPIIPHVKFSLIIYNMYTVCINIIYILLIHPLVY